MKKRVASKKVKLARPVTLPVLTGVQQQVVAYVMSSIAFENYESCCSVEGIAEKFNRTPGRFMSTLRKLVDKGFLTISGDTFQWVYPTVEALQHQDKRLSQGQADKILKRLKG